MIGKRFYILLLVIIIIDILMKLIAKEKRPIMVSLF